MFTNLTFRLAAAAIGSTLATSALAGTPINVDVSADSSIFAYAVGEVVTLGGDGPYHLPQISFRMSNYAQGATPLSISIYNWNGDHVDTGPALFTSTFASVSGSTPTWYAFSFSQQAALNAGTAYLIAVIMPTGAADISVGMNSSGGDPVKFGDMVTTANLPISWFHSPLLEGTDLAMKASFIPVSSAVPEPSTVALMGLGLAGLALRLAAGARRKKA